MSLLLIFLVSSNIYPKDEEYSYQIKNRQTLRYIRPSHPVQQSCLWCNIGPEGERIKKEATLLDDSDSDSFTKDGVPAPAILNLFDIPKYAAAIKTNDTAMNKKQLTELVDKLYLNQL